MATFRCRVLLLDDGIIERDLEKKAVGQVLFDKVCEYLNLLERNYFGLAARDSSNNKVWLDLSRQVHKQIISHDATLIFGVKFYPPDPALLAEDITRYLLCLQLRTDILTGRLPCPSDMLAVLGSYAIQSECGDYDPEVHGKEFYGGIPLSAHQTPELEEKVAELHGTLKSVSPAEADQLFLQNVKTLPAYGAHLHPAQDAGGGDVMLGVCADGLVVYEDEENAQTFVWPAVLNIAYKRSNFQARILHSEDESEQTIRFTLPSYRACKRLWRNAVEHQAFFRDLKDQDQAPERTLRSGSRFRFNGLTHAESLEASSNIKREAPRFARSAIKRKAKENLLVALKRPNRTEFLDWFQALGSDKPWPTTFIPDTVTDMDQLTAGETEGKVEELDNEWFQLLDGRFYPTQHSFSSFSSDADVLESATFRLWKLRADDWFVLLEPHAYQPTHGHSGRTPALSVRSSQAEEQREELEWIEKKTSGKNIRVVQIRQEVRAETEQYEELEMESNLIGPDIEGENLEMEIGEGEKKLEGVWERIVGEGDGEKFQRVVMYEQRTQEVEPFTGHQVAFVERRIKETDAEDAVRELMFRTSGVVSEETVEELEETLLEVESIEQKLQDIERLKVKLQEVEMLEQKLQEVQQAGGQREERDDWYVLLEHKLKAFSAPVRWRGVKTSNQKLQDIRWKNQEREDRGDWYLLLDGKASAVSSARADPTMDTTEQKAEIRRWIEKKFERADILPVLMKDDWYILLDSPLPRPTQTRQPSLPPSVLATAVDVSKETIEEEELRVERRVKTTTHEEEKEKEEEKKREKRRETMETSHETVQVNPEPFQKSAVSSGPTTAVDVYEETREEEEVQRVKKQVKTIRYKEERRETTETSQEVVQMNPVPYDKRVVSSGPAVATAEHKAEIRQWIEEERQRVNTPTSVQMEDDWSVLLDSLPRPTQTRQPALPPSGLTTAVVFYEETREEEEGQREQVKTIRYKEERRETIETSQEVVQMNPVPSEKRAVSSGPAVATAEQKAEIRQWIEEERQRVNTPTSVQMKDDWYISLDSLPRPAQTRQPALPPSEELKKPVKTIQYEEERLEMMETSHGVVQMNPVPFQKRAVPSGLLVDTAEQKAEIRQWIKEERQRVNIPTPVRIKDDWYILLDSLPRPTQTRQPALPPSVLSTAVDVYKETREEEVQSVEKQVKTITYKEERRRMMETSHGVVQMNPVPFEKRAVPSEVLKSQQTVTIKEKVTFDKKPMIIKEDKDNWFVLFTPSRVEKKAIATGVSETWTLKEKRLKEVQKVRLREDLKRSYEVEDKRLHLYVPEPKAEARHRELIDDWFLLLEPVSKKSASADKRAEEEEDRRRKEELFRKRTLAEDGRKVAVPVVPLTPAAQPMTSTPTAQSVRVTRPAYQEESLKRIEVTQDITQDITLDITQESEVQSVETETVIRRKRREKRIEGESIYIRHSILMLEESDVTQEIVLRHHASISELKRIFMDDIAVFGPTEWDRRLSSYTPVIYPKLSDGQLFSGIDKIGAAGLSVM